METAMRFLALQRIARPGDGLVPELFEFFANRQARSADPVIVALRDFNASIPDVAGDAPRPQRAAPRIRMAVEARGRPI
jgi:hypothetical protein